jgi:hypothetical protein
MIDQYPPANGVLTSLIWRKTAAGGETSLSGYDNASQALSYTPGQEQVYLNGILLVRGDDYTATNGTSITGLTALAAGDFVQINCYNNFSVASVPTTSLVGSITSANLPSASTSASGIVQLTDSTSSTSTTTAATPNAVKSAYDLANGAIQKTLTTTTGDIIYASSANTPARLGIGSTGQVLSISGGIPAWSTIASGSMTLLSTTTLSGASTTISSISGSYKDLKIVIRDWATASNGQVYVRLNSISTADSHRFVYAWGYPVSGGSSGTGIGSTTEFAFNYAAYANSSNAESFCEINITDYASTTSWKPVTMNSYYIRENSASRGAEWKWGTLENTSAIDSLYFYGTSNISGTVLVYGVN